MTSAIASGELRWYFREADGDLGMRSNFGSLIARLEGRNIHAEPDMDPRMLHAAHRARMVSRVLSAIPAWSSKILETAFRSDRSAGLCDVPGVMALIVEVRVAYERSKSRRPIQEWTRRLAGSEDPARRRLFVQLKAIAEREIHIALRWFVECAKAYTERTGEGLHVG